MTKRLFSLVLFAAGVTSALAAGGSPQSLVDHWRQQQPAGAVAAALVGRAGLEFFFAGPQSQDDTNPPTAGRHAGAAARRLARTSQLARGRRHPAPARH